MKKLSLKFEDEDLKKDYFEALKHRCKVPVCRNCGKLFELGFPNSEDGVCDFMICSENELLCECPYREMVKRIYQKGEEDFAHLDPYYETK